MTIDRNSRNRGLGAGTVSLAALLLSPLSLAETTAIKEQIVPQTLDSCLFQALQRAGDDVTVGELRLRCEAQLTERLSEEQGNEQPLVASGDKPTSDDEPASSTELDQVAVAPQAIPDTPAQRRQSLEDYSDVNPFALTAHKPNYILPFTYTSDPNAAPFNIEDGTLDNTEIQFQLSFKARVAKNLFTDNDSLYVAYTNRSFWQAYNKDISSPFRETNHEPELFLSFDNDWELWGMTNIRNSLILNHQSNGRSGTVSRSWNRVMASFSFERERFAMNFKPWYRIPESDKSDPMDPTGDDNPDITDFLGRFEWVGAYHNSHNQTFSLMVRDPITTHGKGAYELGWSFPVTENLRGYVTYFEGYGQSLIDYNVKHETIGIGFQLTDWL